MKTDKRDCGVDTRYVVVDDGEYVRIKSAMLAEVYPGIVWRINKQQIVAEMSYGPGYRKRDSAQRTEGAGDAG